MKKLWLTADPGEETGFCIWDGKEIVEPGQERMWKFIDLVDEWLTDKRLPVDFGGADTRQCGGIVCEDWLLYPWVVKAGNLDFDKCRTARAIGALELLTRQHNIPFVLQPASIKEGAEAAGSKELYVTPQHENRHANDAIDHGVFYIAKNNAGLC